MQESWHDSGVYPDSSPQLDGAELSLKYQSHKNTFGTLSTCSVCWLTNPGWWWDGEAIGLQLPSLAQQTVLDQAASWVQEIEANSLGLRKFQKQVIWEKGDRSSSRQCSFRSSVTKPIWGWVSGTHLPRSLHGTLENVHNDYYETNWGGIQMWKWIWLWWKWSLVL